MANKRKGNFLIGMIRGRDFLYAVINLCALAVIVIVSVFIHEELTFFDFLDVGTFTAVVSAFILNSIASAAYGAWKRKKEDDTKLTTDYDALCSMYKLNVRPIVYENKCKVERNRKISKRRTRCKCVKKENELETDVYKIPLADIIYLKGKQIFFENDDPKKEYVRPSFVEENKKELMKAHVYSQTYNQLMFRCDGVKATETAVEFSCSRTTYFDSLMTNRAIDYKVDGISVRDLYAYGPMLPSLEESLLSNHLGYNGFVETSDGKIVFIFRHKHVAIAKNTLQTSVGASLKVKHVFDGCEKLTKEGIVHAIKCEIRDELNLEKLPNYEDRKKDIFKDFSFDNILYFYRELIEGGKPQFMFYGKINLSSDELAMAYTQGVKKTKKKEFFCKMDGFKMMFVEKENLGNIYITADGMSYDGKFYKSVPTSTGCLALLIGYLKGNGEKWN